jgi:C-terminal processing protease CtpA/Prc
MKNFVLSALTILSLLTFSCSDDDSTAQEPNVLLKSEVNDFVWKAMNHWYFWQEDVLSLSDTQDDNIDEFHTYLNGFSSSEDLFESLKFSADDFSWYIDDVQDRLNSIRGISESYGIGLPSNLVRVQQGSDDVVIFVAYIVPGSPADLAGIERGDLIYKVNGSVLNVNNASLINKIFTDINISIGTATFENGSLNPKGSDKSLTAVPLAIDPVHYSDIIEEAGKKIGYLVYNRFTFTYHSELNDVFTAFKNQGVDELILDLRYNPGGVVLTSAYLSSMIEGNIVNGGRFASLTYNAKRNPSNETLYFFRDQATVFDKETGDPTNNIAISRLTNLNRVYVLTSRSTASASEMIINGLRPSMDVIVIGTTTVGKNEGSFTVVDAPGNADNIFTDTENRNPNHTVGLQPIVFQIFNSLGQNDYDEGFEPDIAVDELEFAANILPFGDTDEPLLRTAINNITNATKFIQKPLTSIDLLSKVKRKKFDNELYIMPAKDKLAK